VPNRNSEGKRHDGFGSKLNLGRIVEEHGGARYVRGDAGEVKKE